MVTNLSVILVFNLNADVGMEGEVRREVLKIFCRENKFYTSPSHIL